MSRAGVRGAGVGTETAQVKLGWQAARGWKAQGIEEQTVREVWRMMPWISCTRCGAVGTGAVHLCPLSPYTLPRKPADPYDAYRPLAMPATAVDELWECRADVLTAWRTYWDKATSTDALIRRRAGRTDWTGPR